jgi:hypothetical protein
MEKKMSTTPELLCHGLHDEFQNFLQQAMDLQFDQPPEYDMYRQQFRQLARKMMRQMGITNNIAIDRMLTTNNYTSNTQLIDPNQQS